MNQKVSPHSRLDSAKRVAVEAGFTPILIILGVVLLLGIAGGAYYFGQSSAKLPASLSQVPVSTSQTSISPTQPSTKTVTTPTPIAIDETVPSPTTILKNIKILNTEGWKQVSLNGIYFKIPVDYKCNSDSSCSLIYPPPPNVIAQKVEVRTYNGGSRRVEYLGPSPEDCHFIFEEALFGKIEALQIAADGGWCQGGAGALLAVVGNKLVVFPNLNYDLNTKVIYRFDVRDTIISTLFILK